MDSWTQSVIDFIARNHVWAPWIMLVFAAAETTAFLSILVPSTAVLVAVGALSATGAIDFLPLWAGASAGAMLGSFGSFWLGRRYGGAVLAMRPLSDHPDWVEKASAAFAKWGPATVFGGHFVTFLRPVVFLMAGISGMGWARFAFWNLIGCLSWAWLVPKFGEVGGHLIGWIWGLFTA